MAVFFLKFMNPKHIPSLKKGYIYFSPLETFDKTNEINDIRKINDPNEGVSFIRTSVSDKTKHILFNDQDITKYLVDNEHGFSAELKLHDERVKNIGVFCCTIIDTMDTKEFDINTPKKLILLPSKHKIRVDTKLTLKKSFLSHLYNIVGGNNRIPVFISPKILNLLHAKKIPLMCGPVDYYNDKTKRNFSPTATNTEMIMQSIFKKDSIFNDEKEFRIALLKDCSVKENRTINIGNISKYVKSFHDIPEIYLIQHEDHDIEEIKRQSKKLQQIDLLLIKKRMT